MKIELYENHKKTCHKINIVYCGDRTNINKNIQNYQRIKSSFKYYNILNIYLQELISVNIPRIIDIDKQQQLYKL